MLVDESFDKFFNEKRLSNTELEFSSKPWITNAIKTTIRSKDHLYKGILKTKNFQQKEILYDKFK